MADEKGTGMAPSGMVKEKEKEEATSSVGSRSRRVSRLKVSPLSVTGNGERD